MRNLLMIVVSKICLPLYRLYWTDFSLNRIESVSATGNNRQVYDTRPQPTFITIFQVRLSIDQRTI